MDPRRRKRGFDALLSASALDDLVRPRMGPHLRRSIYPDLGILPTFSTSVCSLSISEGGGVDAAKRRKAAKPVRSLTAAARRVPWSLLQTKWLDLPIVADVGQTCSTWATFAEGFERCLRVVSSHVGQRVTDREGLAEVVTQVVVENLHLLVSQLGEREKIGRVLLAADLLIERRAATQGDAR